MYPRLVPILLAGIALAALTGCTTTDPYTGQTVYDPTRTAALVGGLALAGAAAYAASDDDDDDDRRHQRWRDHRYDDDDHRYPYQYGEPFRSHRDGHLRRLHPQRHADRWDRRFSPRHGIVCYDARRSCFDSRNRYHKGWTRQIYGRRR